MMKKWIMGGLALAFFVLLTSTATALPPGDSVIRLQTKVVRANTNDQPPTGRSPGDLRVAQALLYNRNIQAEALGNYIMACTYLGSGGILGDGTSDCLVTYTLPRGRLFARGLLTSRSFYVLAMTGGSGIYSNTQGTVRVQTVTSNPRRENAFFRVKSI